MFPDEHLNEQNTLLTNVKCKVQLFSIPLWMIEKQSIYRMWLPIVKTHTKETFMILFPSKTSDVLNRSSKISLVGPEKRQIWKSLWWVAGSETAAVGCHWLARRRRQRRGDRAHNWWEPCWSWSNRICVKIDWWMLVPDDAISLFRGCRRCGSPSVLSAEEARPRHRFSSDTLFSHFSSWREVKPDSKINQLVL